jgi:hypothetical protein
MNISIRPHQVVKSDVPHAFRLRRSSVQFFGLHGDVRYLLFQKVSVLQPTESDSDYDVWGRSSTRRTEASSPSP